GGRLVGYNSDWVGAVRALAEVGLGQTGSGEVGSGEVGSGQTGSGEVGSGEVGGLEGSTVSLLGAGGAARAIAFRLARQGARVTVYNRDRSRAEAVAKNLKISFGGGLGDAGTSRPDVVVNATSIGFGSREDVPVSDSIFGSKPLVFDIVYRPSPTAFLERAE